MAGLYCSKMLLALRFSSVWNKSRWKRWPTWSTACLDTATNLDLDMGLINMLSQICSLGNLAPKWNWKVKQGLHCACNSGGDHTTQFGGENRMISSTTQKPLCIPYMHLDASVSRFLTNPHRGSPNSNKNALQPMCISYLPSVLGPLLASVNEVA